MTTTPYRTAHNQLMLDLFNTAIEGGIEYWTSVISYYWLKDGGVEDTEGFYARIVDEDATLPGESPRIHMINLATMRRGYKLATSSEWRNRLSWSSGVKPPIVVTPSTDWDFDASDADMILQLGLFGDVVYG